MSRPPLLEKRALAIELRKMGYSTRIIARQLHVAQSSVSLWVRNVYLTAEQVARIGHGRPKPTLEMKLQRRIYRERCRVIRNLTRRSSQQEPSFEISIPVIESRIAKMRAIKLQYFKKHNTYYLPDELAMVVDLGP